MANLKLIDELLEKTEYIYVLGIDGKSQMPTNRKVRVRKLFKLGRAKIVDTVPFTIQLLYKNEPVLQPITIAEDSGRTNIGAAVLTQLGNLVFSAVVETRNKSIKKLMTDRKAHRQASRRGERKARQRLAKRHGSMIKAGMIIRKLPQYAADKFVTCKIIKNTEARFCNRKRIPDWLTPTVNHLVQTHVNLIKKVEKYLPMTTIRWKLYNEVKALFPDIDIDIHITYGAETKERRRALDIDKSHVNDAFVMGQFHPKHRSKPICYKKKRRNNRCLEKFHDAKYIGSRDGKKRSGQELFNGRTSRNHKKDSENLHQYRLQKVTPGRRTIRRQHYPIQPHDIIVYNGNKIEVSGCQHKGTRVVFSKTKKSVQISKIKLFKYAGGYSKSVFN